MMSNLESLVLCAAPDEALISIIGRIANEHFDYHGFCCVIDENNRLLGVFNSRDIFRYLNSHSDFKTATAVDVMSKDPIVANASSDYQQIFSVVSKMSADKFGVQKRYTRYIPIVDGSNSLIDVLDLNSFQDSASHVNIKASIYGMGYVGLTLACALASRGVDVMGIDNSPNILADLEKKKVHIHEPHLQEILEASIDNEKIRFSSEAHRNQGQYHIIAVGTPVDSSGTPDLCHVNEVLDSIIPILMPYDTVIIRSTVPLGTTRSVVLPVLKKSGLKIGENLFLGFCPERTVEGNAINELFELPQVVSGVTDRCSYYCSKLFKTLTSSLINAESIEQAELVKLINNSYRDMTFAFANSLIPVTRKFNLDTNRTIMLANEGYQRSSVPKASPGVGGYCLTKDPYILASVDRGSSHGELLINARKINESAHADVIETIMNFCKKNDYAPEATRIIAVGMAFKGQPETNDYRGSTSITIVNELIELGFDLICSDKVITDDTLESLGYKTAIQGNEGQAQIYLIMNNHPENIEGDLVKKIRKDVNVLFYDAWGLAGREEMESYKNISYATLGYMTKR